MAFYGTPSFAGLVRAIIVNMGQAGLARSQAVYGEDVTLATESRRWERRWRRHQRMAKKTDRLRGGLGTEL
jgi:hypothetical protein